MVMTLMTWNKTFQLELHVIMFNLCDMFTHEYAIISYILGKSDMFYSTLVLLSAYSYCTC